MEDRNKFYQRQTAGRYNLADDERAEFSLMGERPLSALSEDELRQLYECENPWLIAEALESAVSTRNVPMIAAIAMGSMVNAHSLAKEASEKRSAGFLPDSAGYLEFESPRYVFQVIHEMAMEHLPIGHGPRIA